MVRSLGTPSILNIKVCFITTGATQPMKTVWCLVQFCRSFVLSEEMSSLCCKCGDSIMFPFNRWVSSDKMLSSCTMGNVGLKVRIIFQWQLVFDHFEKKKKAYCKSHNIVEVQFLNDGVTLYRDTPPFCCCCLASDKKIDSILWTVRAVTRKRRAELTHC